MACGETPDLAVAILAALEHAKNPSFYAPYESPIVYGFQKKKLEQAQQQPSNQHPNLQLPHRHNHRGW